MSSAIPALMKRKRPEAIAAFTTTNKTIDVVMTSKKRKIDDAITESKKSKTTIDDIPTEVLNDIFELVVVHRYPGTGERLAIQVYIDLRSVARVQLRASRTCKKFQVMVPMFFGLNVFEIWQTVDYRRWRLDLLGREEPPRTIEFGLQVVESAWHFNVGYAVKHEIHLPPVNCCEMLKEVVFYVGIAPAVVEGGANPSQREELVAENPSWLFAIK